MQGQICDKMKEQQSSLGQCLSESERRQESWSGQTEGWVTNRAEPASWHMQLDGAHNTRSSGLHNNMSSVQNIMAQ